MLELAHASEARPTPGGPRSTPDATNPPSNTLGGAIPIFCVARLSAAIEYYRSALGFKLDWEGPGVFASVSAAAAISFSARTTRGTPVRGPGSV